MTSSRRKRGPLAGLRVVDASRVLAGPYLAMLLGDLGADVVKVERPDGGDPTRGWGPPFVGKGEERAAAYYVSTNRSKRSIALDLTSAPGRAAFERLVGRADVLIENFLPLDWRRLGFRRFRFHKVHPALVQATISGYGTTGPDADRPAYDIALQAESGLMSLTGFETGEPVRVGIAIVDILAALYGLTGVLAALRNREATGRGRHVAVALADAGTAFLSYAAQSYLADGRQPARLGSRHPSLTPYQAFRTADGWLVVGVGSEALWRRFCRALAWPELAEDARFATSAARVGHRAALDSLLEPRFASETTAHWERLCRQHRVPAAPPATVAEAVEKARGRGQVVPLPDGPYGPLETIAAPFVLDGRRLLPTAPPPALGEHTTAILREAGFGRREIAELLRTGAALSTG